MNGCVNKSEKQHQKKKSGDIDDSFEDVPMIKSVVVVPKSNRVAESNTSYQNSKDKSKSKNFDQKVVSMSSKENIKTATIKPACKKTERKYLTSPSNSTKKNRVGKLEPEVKRCKTDPKLFEQSIVRLIDISNTHLEGKPIVIDRLSVADIEDVEPDFAEELDKCLIESKSTMNSVMTKTIHIVTDENIEHLLDLVRAEEVVDLLKDDFKINAFSSDIVTKQQSTNRYVIPLISKQTASTTSQANVLKLVDAEMKNFEKRASHLISPMSIQGSNGEDIVSKSTTQLAASEKSCRENESGVDSRSEKTENDPHHIKNDSRTPALVNLSSRGRVGNSLTKRNTQKNLKYIKFIMFHNYEGLVGTKEMQADDHQVVVLTPHKCRTNTTTHASMIMDVETTGTYQVIINQTDMKNTTENGVQIKVNNRWCT